MRYLAPIVTSFAANAKSGAHVNRHDFWKLIVGAGASLGFAALAFGPLGFGLRYTDELERRAQDALADRRIEAVDVTVVRQPALKRDILLSGKVDPGVRRDAIAVVRSVPGAAQVTWAESNSGSGGSGSGLAVHY